jgi:hypothetical protein
MINIVTSICVDTKPEDSTINYPMIGIKSSEQKRKLYWKLATTFLCSSLRCNPQDEHVVYTNDPNPIIIIKGIDLKKRLQELGVKIEFLSFESFMPPASLSKAYKNAFYKLQVIKELGEIENSS